jgi:hypothetical protein
MASKEERTDGEKERRGRRMKAEATLNRHYTLFTG